VLVGTPVLAFQEPEPPATTTTTIPLTPSSEAPAAPESTTTTAAPSATQPATPEGTTVEEGWESDATPVEATLVGVTWDGDPDAEFTVEVQSSDGTWTAEELHATDTLPDAGSADAARAESFPDNGTEPLWVGDDTTAVRVTLDEGQAANVEVAAIDSQPTPAPEGAAGAITGELGTVDGAGRWVFGAALFAVVALLVALALGWRPRRLRLRLLGIVAGALVLAACVPVAQPAPPSGPPADGPYPPTPLMYSREAWGARPFSCAGGPEYAADGLQFAVVHHTVNSNSYGPRDGAALVRGIQSYHMDVNGYCDIAYNFLVDRWGVIYIGRQGGSPDR
jgi:hypothetical protein